MKYYLQYSDLKTRGLVLIVLEMLVSGILSQSTCVSAKQPQCLAQYSPVWDRKGCRTFTLKQFKVEQLKYICGNNQDQQEACEVLCGSPLPMPSIQGNVLVDTNWFDTVVDHLLRKGIFYQHLTSTRAQEKVKLQL